MDLVLWAALAGAVVALAATVLNVALIPRVRTRAPLDDVPRVSLIVPARNEERSIERSIVAFLGQDYPDVEVIVVDDRSTDATGAIARSIAGSDRRLLVVPGKETPAGWLGKPWALQQGAERATGELLLFVDADVRYAPGAVTAFVTELQRSGAAMCSLVPHVEMKSFWEHVAMPQLAVMLFTALPSWLSNRWQHPILAIGGGPGNMIRRSDYDAIGGHEALRDAVVDDIALARLVRRNGRRSVFARSERLVSVRMYHDLHEIVDGFTKNAFATFNRSYAATAVATLIVLLFQLFPWVAAFAGHPVAIATVLLMVLTRAILFASIRYSLAAAVFLQPLQSALWLWILTRSMWVTGVRRRLVWRGRTYDAGDTRFGADR